MFLCVHRIACVCVIRFLRWQRQGCQCDKMGRGGGGQSGRWKETSGDVGWNGPLKTMKSRRVGWETVAALFVDGLCCRECVATITWTTTTTHARTLTPSLLSIAIVSIVSLSIQNAQRCYHVDLCLSFLVRCNLYL